VGWGSDSMSIAHAEEHLVPRVVAPRAHIGLAALYIAYGLTVLAVPFLLSKVYLGDSAFVSLPVAEKSHIILNWFCILAVIYASAKFGGTFEWQLPRIVAFAAAIHGSLATVVLAGRLYFSRPILFSCFFISIALGLAIAWLENRRKPLKLAIIDPDSAGEANTWLDSRIERVSDPSRDLRIYDLVLVNFSKGLPANWTEAISRAMVNGCRIRHIAEYVEKVRGRVSIEHFMHDQYNSQRIRIYRYSKRVLDVVIVALTLPLVVPVLLLGMGLVAVSMGRPIFFKQSRLGVGQKVFTMWKLRTMQVSQSVAKQIATEKNDPRITKMGRFLRRYRIDELPQLWNVLVGNMSLIGPRPEQPDLAEFYTREIPAFSYRCIVRPGITGWAQVSTGYAANVGESRSKLTYDLYYVKNMSFSLDFEIALRTVWTLIYGNDVR
jgi:lipopolysaccharide/colanic/teichoic acid biosynthesis glycosyltransferase